MDTHPQDDSLDLSSDVGLCRDCGLRRVLCQYGQCMQCHDASKTCSSPSRRKQPGELCCGWFATGPLLEMWQCPTCGRIV